MASIHTEYTTLDAILDAKARIGAEPRQRLTWAVQFAQENFDTLPPGRLADLQAELTGFLPRDYAAQPGRHPLVSREDMRATQQRFIGIITKVLRKESFTIGPYPVETSVFWMGDTSYHTIDIQRADLPQAERALYVFGTLLQDGRDLIKACPAPPMPCRQSPQQNRQGIQSRKSLIHKAFG